MGLLDKINSPKDLKSLSCNEMIKLNKEIRKFLIKNITNTGGHLASNLGVVELTTALHKVFDSPYDNIIWDVGHQSYIHKILTGRKKDFSTLRQYKGMSGFTKRAESPHDSFGAGHSSTSVSAALGFAQAERLKNSKRYTVAVVGDGAFTGGLIHEALNNCQKDLRLIIILNENEMSISKNVGNLSIHLSKIRSSPKYFRLKHETESFLSKLPLAGKSLSSAMRYVKSKAKSAIYASNYFEELGLYYIGPVDGNDYKKVELLLREAKARQSSVIVHIKTKKGFGYKQAQENPEQYHIVSSGCGKSGKCYSSIFSDAVCMIAEKNEKVCAITAAMCSGTGLDEFKERFPERFFDVGIAEGHAVVFAAGLSCKGFIPIFAVYSTFLQRAYDQLLHDASLQLIPMILCIDRAGLSEGDGATHHGIFDVSFLFQLDYAEIYTPIFENSIKKALLEASENPVLSAIRYSKGYPELNSESFYKYSDWIYILNNSNIDKKDFSNCDCIIITYGRVVSQAIDAIKMISAKEKDRKVNIGIMLLEKIKPLKQVCDALERLVPKKDCLILFLEEGIRTGGAGLLLYDKIYDEKWMKNNTYKTLAIETIPEQGDLSELYHEAKINSHFIAEQIKTYIENNG